MDAMVWTTGVPGFIGGIGTTEILVVLVIVLLLFGPKKLPGLARSLGKGLGTIRSASDDIRREIRMDDLDSDTPGEPPVREPPEAPVAPPPPPPETPPTTSMPSASSPSDGPPPAGIRDD